jgi:hypothetical protein
MPGIQIDPETKYTISFSWFSEAMVLKLSLMAHYSLSREIAAHWTSKLPTLQKSGSLGHADCIAIIYLTYSTPCTFKYILFEIELFIIFYLYSEVRTSARYRLDGPRIRIPVQARISVPVQTCPEDHLATYTKGIGSFPGVKRSGRGVDHPPRSSVEVKERVELYLYSHLWIFVACIVWLSLFHRAFQFTEYNDPTNALLFYLTKISNQRFVTLPLWANAII